MKLKPITLLIGIVLVSFIYAITGSVTNFEGQDNPFNITLDGENNETYFLQIPLHAYINNLTLNLTGCHPFFETQTVFPNEDVYGLEPVSILHFDNGTDGSWAHDSSGNGWQGQPFGTPLRVEGLFANATFLNGTTDYYKINDLPAINDNFTLMFWFNSSNTTNIKQVFVRYGNGNPGTAGVYIDLNNQLYNTFRFAVKNQVLQYNASNLKDGNFHHVAVTYNMSQFTVFYDGEIVNQTDFTDQNVFIQENVFIGSSIGNDLLIGTLDDFVILNSSINLSTINEIISPYPTNPKIKSNSRTLWDYSGFLSSEVEASLNITVLNEILEGGCTCTNCSISGVNCKVPFVFYSDSSSTLQVDIINASYEYGIDNCSNSFNLPSNGTALNVTFLDALTLAPSTVNVTTVIEGIANYSTTFTNIDNYQLCVYPSWFNQSEPISIQYNLGASYSHYDFDAYLNNETQQLTLYTQPSTQTTTFTVKDKDTNDNLADVLTTMYRRISGNWEVIESKTTDITGRAQFSYQPEVEYRFFFAKADYENYIFYLNPILFSSYDVKMTQSIVLNETQDYDRVALIYSPTLFYNGENNFTFLIQSPYSELTAYGYSLTYPGGSTSEAGSDSVGSQLDSTFTITGATNFDRLRLDYYYDTELSGLRNFTFYYAISVPTSNYTMVEIRDQKYGLGLFERVLIAVSIVVLVVGIASLIGQPIPGMALGLIILGYLTYIGLVPIWASIISIMLGLLFIGMKGEG